MPDYSNASGPPPYGLEISDVCELGTCPIQWSIYQYRPSLAANAFFLAAFAAVGAGHLYLGVRWRSWGFMAGMLLGCATEVIGYAGRVLLWRNPFSFDAFLVQIVCLTIGPVFYTASIYVTLSKAVSFFGPGLSRFRPQLFYCIFIPLDIVCLALQAAGGALSATNDDDQAKADLGVDLAMAGLILQVVVIVFFAAFFGDYLARLARSDDGLRGRGWRVNAFFAGLAAAVLLVLGRCAYRVAELKDGYDGELITHQAEFVVLEGVFVLVAAAALGLGHPGLGFKDGRGRLPGKDSESDVAMREAGGV